METPGLTAADPTTSSSNHHSEPEAQNHDNPTESAANEVENIYEESTKQIEEGQTEKTIEPREEVGVFEQPNDPIGKGKEKIEISEEEVVDSAGNEAEIRSHPYPQTHASGSFRSTILPFYEDGESSLPTEPQGDKSKDTTAAHAGEETSAGSLASSSLLSPPSNHLKTSLSLVTEEGTSRAASNSQQSISQILRATKEFSALLSEFLQILEAQPSNTVSAEQGQFMVDAFRDLSNMNFSIEWFSPYVEEVRECLEQEKEISEIELKIAQTEAQLQALKEKKKALQEKRRHFHLV